VIYEGTLLYFCIFFTKKQLFGKKHVFSVILNIYEGRLYLNFWKRAILALLGHLDFFPSASDRLNLGTSEQGDFEKQ